MGEKNRVEGKLEVAGVMGPLWILGWLFTVGYVQLALPKALWAVVVWPYYLGQALAKTGA